MQSDFKNLKNIKEQQMTKTKTIKVNISPLIADDSAEYQSLADSQKQWGMQDTNINSLNTRGVKNKPVEIKRDMEFKLSPFDILHFDEIELLTISGGAFYNGHVIQENACAFGEHKYINGVYNTFKQLQKRLFIPTNLSELKQDIKIILSALFGREQKRLANNAPKILFHSPNWDCFSHFSFEEFPRLLACLKAILKAKNMQIPEGGGGNEMSKALDQNLCADFHCTDFQKLREINFDELIIIAPIRDATSFKQYIYPALLSITKEHNPDCEFAISEKNIVCVNSVKLPQKMLIKARNVFVPTQVKYDKEHLSFAMEHLRKFYYDENFDKGCERIYISRAKSAKRFLVNEKEFREFIEKKFGFKTLIMEEVTFKDKINYLSRAKVLLSVDGTSIMNYAYMQGGKAVALRVKEFPEYPFQTIFGVDFLPIICDIDTPVETDFGYGAVAPTWWASNIKADIPYIESKLKAYGIEPISQNPSTQANTHLKQSNTPKE